VISRSLHQLDHVHGWGLAALLQDRHLSAASSFHIGVLRERRIASSGMLARVLPCIRQPNPHTSAETNPPASRRSIFRSAAMSTLRPNTNTLASPTIIEAAEIT